MDAYVVALFALIIFGVIIGTEPARPAGTRDIKAVLSSRKGTEHGFCIQR